MKASGLHIALVREAYRCIESLWRDMRGVMSDLSLCVALCASACVCVPVVFVRVASGKLLIRAFELTGLCVLANPVYQMCGAAVEPAGTGGAGR